MMNVFPELYELGAITEASKGWLGSAYCPTNNCMYMAPAIATKILKYDLTTGAVTYITATGGYQGCTYYDGFVWFFPHNASRVMKLNCGDDSVAYIGTSYGTTPNKWYAGVLAPNSSFYCTQSLNVATVLKIDTVTNTTSLLSNAAISAAAHTTYCLATNGKLYGAARKATTFLEIDPATDTFRTISFPHAFTTDGAFIRAIPLTDGRVMAMPWQYPYIVIYNPANDSFTNIGPDLSSFTTKACVGQHLLASKVFVSSTSALGNGFVVDYVTGAVTKTFYRSGLDCGITPNGDILFVPISTDTKFFATRGVYNKTLTFQGAPPANLADLPTSNWNFLYNNL